MGVISGTVVALVLGRFLFWVLPDYGIFTYETGSREATVLSGIGQTMADLVSVFTWAICWALAYFLGGAVAGMLARTSVGINGALTAVCGGFFGIGSFLVAVGPVNAVMDSENLALTIIHAMVFSLIFLPITILTSYLGGKVGGHLCARVAVRAFD